VKPNDFEEKPADDDFLAESPQQHLLLCPAIEKPEK